METSMMVRYSSVVIGGKPYICPVKGVALSRLPLFFSASKKHSRQPVFVTRLNDTTFTGYHLFRTEMKILPGNGSNRTDRHATSTVLSLTRALRVRWCAGAPGKAPRSHFRQSTHAPPIR